jgi:hypothetical protein
MVKIIIATMVKNEDDIVKKWIEYHGSIFGYNNLFIIENYSTDATYEICKEYLRKGINLFRKKNYKKKGDYMTYCKNNINCDIFIPLDIDEFICYYDNTTNKVNKNRILNYLNSLMNNPNGFYKMNYLLPINTNNSDGMSKFTHGTIGDWGKNAKTFVIKKHVDPHFIFDHGNHVSDRPYILSNLLLIHFSQRSHEQNVKKIIANVTGLGYEYQLDKLKALPTGCAGNHRVLGAINLLENPNMKLDPPLYANIRDNWIDLRPLQI